MGYFSNSTEGDMWEHQWCDRCVHRPNYDPENWQDCPILKIHCLFNYRQMENKEESLKEVLSILIPVDNTDNLKCSLFLEGIPEWMCTEQQHNLF